MGTKFLLDSADLLVYMVNSHKGEYMTEFSFLGELSFEISFSVGLLCIPYQIKVCSNENVSLS